jgi:hypothetical protein
VQLILIRALHAFTNSILNDTDYKLKIGDTLSKISLGNSYLLLGDATFDHIRKVVYECVKNTAASNPGLFTIDTSRSGDQPLVATVDTQGIRGFTDFEFTTKLVVQISQSY